jgi:TetR/AcrR family transcriptional repressor of nem operon
MARAINTEVRERIVATAYQLFLEQGFKSVSMDDIAKEVGLKKANLFYYYPSKEALGLAVLGKHRKIFRERIDNRFADKLQDPIDAVVAMYSDLRERINIPGSDSPSIVTNIVVEMSGSYGSLQTQLAEDLGFWVEYLTNYLHSWKQQGYFTSSLNTKCAAMMCVSLVHGSMVYWQATRDPQVFYCAAESARSFLRQYKAV